MQSEVLRSIFERTQKPVYAKVSAFTQYGYLSPHLHRYHHMQVTMDIIRRLFESQGRNLFHHLNLIQDWLR